MDPPQAFPYTDEEMAAAGLLGDDVSQPAQQAIATMRAHPELLKLPLFALQCIDEVAKRESLTSSVPTLSDWPGISVPIPTSTSQDSDTYAVSEYEKTTYYNGITHGGDHPDLLYRSDLFTNPFPEPKGRYAHLPTKSVQGVHDTPLNKVWDTVGPQIRNLVKDRKVRYSSIDPARFVTYGEDDAETLGPVVIWIGVYPGSTSPETAHEVSQNILTLLVKNGVDGAVVEWREAVPSKLSGPSLMRVVPNTNPTAHLRRIFTPALNMPLATAQRKDSDAQGSLTLYFHEGKDKHGNPSDKVLGVSNCHVLRKTTDVDYEFRGSGAPKQYVRVNGLRRFQEGLDEIKAVISERGELAELLARDIAKFDAKETSDSEEAEDFREARENLLKQQETIAKLEDFYNEVKIHWCDIGLRNIGHLRYAKAISVDVEGGTLFTEDWAVFELDKAKFKREFEGNVVDLGTALSPGKVREKFYPRDDGGTTFKYPLGRKLKIQGVITPELLANPDLYDSEGKPCLVAGKDGTKTGLTFGRYAGLVSFLCDERGVESTELGIYNWGKNSGVFSDKGDSGALIWDGLGRILGQIHSGQSKGGSASPHVTYATPGWWLLQRIKAKFPHAVFDRITWSE